MSDTMFITPDDIINYTSFDDVKNRNTDALTFDIISAQEEIFQYVGHRFDDIVKYPSLPTQARLAFILLAEYNALISMDDSYIKGYESESFGSGAYTYRASKDSKAIEKPKILSLLKPYIDSAAKQAMQMNQATLNPVRVRFFGV